VVHDGAVILADDVDAEFLHSAETLRPTHHHVLIFELKRIALDAFRGKALVVDEGPVGRLDIFDEDLQ
jgi:hypothetical protein